MLSSREDQNVKEASEKPPPHHSHFWFVILLQSPKSKTPRQQPQIRDQTLGIWGFVILLQSQGGDCSKILSTREEQHVKEASEKPRPHHMHLGFVILLQSQGVDCSKILSSRKETNVEEASESPRAQQKPFEA